MVSVKETITMACQRHILQNVTVSRQNGLFGLVAFLRSATQCIIKVFTW